MNCLPLTRLRVNVFGCLAEIFYHLALASTTSILNNNEEKGKRATGYKVRSNRMCSINKPTDYTKECYL